MHSTYTFKKVRSVTRHVVGIEKVWTQGGGGQKFHRNHGRPLWTSPKTVGANFCLHFTDISSTPKSYENMNMIKN